MLVEYNFYIPNGMDEQEVAPPTEPTPAEASEPTPELPADIESATTGEPALPTDLPTDTSTNEKGEVEIDITDLVNSSKDTKEKIEGTNELLNNLISKFDEFENKMSAFDQIVGRIDQLEQDLDKRLPTPVEKLEMRSLDSFPYSVKLSDFWSEEVDNIEDDVTKTDNEEYILTPEDIKKDYSASSIKTSFDVQSPEDQDYSL